MKKLAALLLILVLCLGSALAETANLTGVWYLNEMADDEMTLHPGTMGLEMTLILNADSTASMSVVGKTDVGTWLVNDQDVVVTIQDDPQTFTYVDGNLVAVMDGVSMIFGREKVELPSIELGEAKTDATMADYNGKWSATMVDFLGMRMSLADMGTTMEITIADGKVTLKETAEGAEPMTDEGNVTVENGMASITVPGSNEAVSVQLYEGDVLMWVNPVAEDVNMTIYFEKAAE